MFKPFPVAPSFFRRRSPKYEKRIFASSCLSVRPSLRSHGTTRLPVDGFPWNLASEDFFEKLPRKFRFFLKNSDESNEYFAWYLCMFMIICRWIIVRIRNVADRNCSENHDAQFLNPPPPRKTCRFGVNVEKFGTARHTGDNIIRNMRFACRITKARIHTRSNM